MPPFMFSSLPTNRGRIDDENADYEHVIPDSTDMNISDEVKQISWDNTCQRILEHSFSDISQFNLNSIHESTPTESRPRDLRADFVHLFGVSIGLHTDESPTIDLHEEKDGFQLRSIVRSVSSIGLDSQHNSEKIGGTKTIVVIPSMDLDRTELNRWCSGIQSYQERQLYHLLLTSDPTVRIIYITSRPVDSRVVAYYLGLCHKDDHESEHPQTERFSDVYNKLTRVFMINVPSKRCIPLSDKILQDNNLVKFVKDLIHQRRDVKSTDSAGLCLFAGSESTYQLSQEFNIKHLEASREHLHFGTKQGSRDMFRACCIPHPAGTPSIDDDDLLTYGAQYGESSAGWSHNHKYIRSSRALAIGISRQILIHGVHPRKWMVKLNQGFSGKGNASINLQKFQECTKSPTEVIEDDILDLALQIEAEFEVALKFEDPEQSWHGTGEHPGFQAQIERLGVIAEAFLEGEVPTSPSIQAVIEPDAKTGSKVSIISTHEQLLDGQVYQGCINPASESYRSQICEYGLKVGQYMASHGVIGHFSCDFLATQKSDGLYEVSAIEINLRQGGTTHPQATMALLCGGCVCSDGVFRTTDNEERCYIATDNEFFDKPCSESHLIDAIESKTSMQARKIRWNKDERVGVVFHLFQFARIGRIGFTAIGRSMEESQDLFDATREFLSQL